MKRFVVLMAGVCALALMLAVAPAFGGPPQPGGIMIPEASNTALLSNDPVLSGNSVALVNTGDQTSSADPTLVQQNGSAGSPPSGTTDDAQPAASPSGPSGPDGSTGGSNESNTAVLSNDPVLSGNSVAGVNGGGCTCDGGGQSSSADPTLVQQNGPRGNSQGGGETNVAILSNDPVASGNSVALVNTGDQTSSADPTLIQQNSGGQGGKPDDQQGYSKDGCRCQGRQGDSKGGGGEKNVAILSNDPVASGNSVALVNTGDQTSSADPTLIQQNGGQTDEKQWNGKSDGQGPPQQKPCPKPEPKPCPKPEPKPCPEPKPAPCHPKPCPKPEPKPCPKPEPKPCPEPKPAPCQPKPCPPKPCEQGGGGNMIGAVTNAVALI